MRHVLLLLLCLPVALEAQVTEVWSTKGPDDYPFGEVQGVYDLGDGGIWVLDAIGSYHAHILDADGHLLRRTVRDGEGPGELPTVKVGAPTPEGGIALTDAVEMHFLDAQGEYVSKMPFLFQPYMQKDLKITPDYILHSAGMALANYRDNHPDAVFVYDRRTGELVSSFHPANETPGRLGRYQSGAMLAVRGPDVIAVNIAPLEVVEYEIATGRKVRTIVPTDSSLVNDLGEAFRFRLKDRPGYLFYRWHYPRVRYAGLLSEDRLLVVVAFPLQDYALRPDELALDVPPEEYERSIWDVYDLRTGERLSRTESSRAYIVYDRTSDGGFLASYTTSLDEAVVVKLRFQPE